MKAKKQPPQNPSFPVNLPIWEWHHLLKSMEESMSVVNRDRTNVRILYGKIASQLAGYTVDVTEPKSHLPPQPSDKPPSQPAPDTVEPPKDKSKTLLQRLFSSN